jgi:RecA/RadA recombinase
MVQLPVGLGGLDGSALYISTEKSIYTERMKEIAKNIKDRMNNSKSHKNNFRINWSMCDNIYVRYVDNSAALLSLFENVSFSSFVEDKSVKLIVIDSIAAFLRTDFSNDKNSNMKKRSDFLVYLCSLLKALFCVFYFI